MSNIANIIGERIRLYRNHAGLTQEVLAEKAGLHSTYIGQLERGEKNATLESVEKVVCALDLPFEILFENIIIGSTKNEYAAECYEMITALPVSEQKAILELIKKAIDYKNT